MEAATTQQQADASRYREAVRLLRGIKGKVHVSEREYFAMSDAVNRLSFRVTPAQPRKRK